MLDIYYIQVQNYFYIDLVLFENYSQSSTDFLQIYSFIHGAYQKN